MTAFATLDDFDCAGKTVLVRADLNAPVHDGAVSDCTRLARIKPTVDSLARRGAKIVLMSHFGRPKGKPSPSLSLRAILPSLIRSLERPVAFAEDCIGEPAQKMVEKLGPGEAGLLENLRFHPGEEANDPDFAAHLAALGDFYVDDAFSAAHRAHASTEAIAHLLPAAAGALMQAELEALTDGLEMPERPVAAIVGGAKISTKLTLLRNLVSKVDFLILGGGMANTFLHGRGVDVGKSLCEPDMAEEVRAVNQEASDRGCTIMLPEDALVARALEPNAPYATVSIRDVPADAMMLDIGPKTVKAIEDCLDRCRTLVWNGPLGAFEVPPFDSGTVAVARFVADRTRNNRLYSVAGGGDTLSALAKANAERDLSYVSTAGGAFLEWLEGKNLPGVAALRRDG